MSKEQDSISRLEYSLAEFLIDYQASHFADIRTFAYKYNNLKIFMSPLQVSKPHFFVRFGISEACFSIETGNKLDGGLGPEDRMVQKWANRINVHRELETYWKELSHRSKIKLGDAGKKKSERDGDQNENSINISAIIRGQKKKTETKKRQAEKWWNKKKDDKKE